MANQIIVDLAQTGPSTSEVTVRKHKLLVDRPEAKGGADQGPMGGELFLAAIGGCFMSNLLAAIKAREAGVTGAAVNVAGMLVDAPTRFTAVALTVSAQYQDRALFEKLVEIADRGCIMTNTLRGKLELSIQIA
ncbi:MAG: OsmC family protein [Bryobacteraceae bacterium]